MSDADLVQIVDLSVKEAESIRSLAETTDDGRHYVELVEADGTCDACVGDEEARIIEQDGEYVVENRKVYRIKELRRTSLLCREHLKQQPTHIELRDDIPQTGGA